MKYSEMLEDGASEARERERLALDRSIALMEQAMAPGAGPQDVATAIVFANRLWAVLIEDLATPTNGLPKSLRAQIVSIGIWIMREVEGIRSGEKSSFSDAIEVSKAIRDGLL